MGLFRLSRGQGGFPFGNPPFVFGNLGTGRRRNTFGAKVFEAVDDVRPILDPLVWILFEQLGDEFGKHRWDVRIPL